MKNRFFAISAAIMLLSSAVLFAAGVKEIGEKENTVKVLSVNLTEDGTYEFLAQNEMGIEILYRADDEHTTALPSLEAVQPGSVLAIKDNGMMTMSIPGQTWATEIRDITLGVNNGYYDVSFAPVKEMRPAAASSDSSWMNAMPETVLGKFSYAYGYDLMSSYQEQGLTLKGSYFLKGFLDFQNNVETLLVPMDAMIEKINNYFTNVFGIVTDKTKGDMPSSYDEILSLGASEDEDDLFAYSYGFYIAYQNFYSGIDFEGEYFAAGAAAAIFGVDPIMDEAERTAAIDEYIAQLQAEYDAYIAELSAYNLEQAESFLADNAAAEGVITTESGLQYVVNAKGDGAQPTQDSTVTVTYTLRDLAGNVLDQGENASFPVSGVIPGFGEAVCLMKVGGSVTAYVHPSLGYGEAGAQTIAPNTLLIFDIELSGVEN